MRSRNIKPGFFENEDLADLPFAARLLFIGLWCCADREGRMEDRPRRIRVQIFPFDMDVDVEQLLQLLSSKGFIDRYEVQGSRYISIPKFLKHQNPHKRERESELPEKPSNYSARTDLGLAKAGPRQGRARLIPDSLIPDSLIPEPPLTPPPSPDGSVKLIIKQTAARLRARHRRRLISQAECEQKLTTILAKVANGKRADLLAAIDRSHERHCASEDWTKDGGQFIPGLGVFLNPQKRRWEVPPDAPAVAGEPPEDREAEIAAWVDRWPEAPKKNRALALKRYPELTERLGL